MVVKIDTDPLFTSLYVSTTIHHHWGGPKRYLKIQAYDLLRDMLEDANRMNKIRGHNEEPVAGAWGIFHPAMVRERWNKHTQSWDRVDNHYAGLIRVWKEVVGAEVIMHELVHATSHIYRLDVDDELNLGPINDDAKEEFFAYILGDLAEQTSRALHRAKLW